MKYIETYVCIHIYASIYINHETSICRLSASPLSTMRYATCAEDGEVLLSPLTQRSCVLYTVAVSAVNL